MFLYAEMECKTTELEQWAQVYLGFTTEDLKILSVYLIGKDLKFANLFGFFYHFIEDISISSPNDKLTYD